MIPELCVFPLLWLSIWSFLKLQNSWSFLCFLCLVASFWVSIVLFPAYACLSRAAAWRFLHPHSINSTAQGECPACRKQFVGYKSQTVRCASCGNIVWQPQGDFFSRGGKGTSSSSKSQPDIIDVEFEEKWMKIHMKPSTWILWGLR